MLKSIICDLFKQHQVIFHPGLNIVMGDEVASNSIGKSTMLLAIDFAFGGNTYAKQQTLINNEGHHSLSFVFEFGGENYYFSRTTDAASLVSRYNENWKLLEDMTIEDYSQFLKSKYINEDISLSFREMLGTYSRVYGKDNYNEHTPLHSYPTDSGEKIIRRVLKLFNYYKRIEEQEYIIDKKKERFKSITEAGNQKVIKLWKKIELQNKNKEINSLNVDINNIATEIASKSIDLTAEKMSKVEGLKQDLARLQIIKSKLSAQLNRLHIKSVQSKEIDNTSLNDLQEFFPSIELKSVGKICKFHEQLNDILSTEIKEQIKRKESNLSQIDKKEDSIVKEISATIDTTNGIRLAIERLLSKKSEVDSYLPAQILSKEKISLQSDIKLLREMLDNTKVQLLTEIQQKINARIKQDNDEICKGSKEPMISLSPKKYTYSTFDDTGTGTNFKGLILLDIAILQLTSLPILIHDSILFKNIEYETMDNLIKLYSSFSNKQVFIATDSINVYNLEAQQILNDNIVLQLGPNGNELFGNSWRKN